MATVQYFADIEHMLLIYKLVYIGCVQCTLVFAKPQIYYKAIFAVI